MSVSTTIVIPGRETQTIPGLTLSKSDVIASFAGDIDLSQMVATESREEGNVTISFANRTGTKGADVYVSGDLNIQVEGDLVINSTRIDIPGRESQTIPGMVLGRSDVISAFASELDLAGMDCNECDEGEVRVFSFANRTGTKGQVNLIDAIMAAVNASNAQQQVEDFSPEDLEEELDDEDEELLVNTNIEIPGREAQLIRGIVLDAQMVKDSFSGEIDLSGYDVEEVERGDTLHVIFKARTGTKGN